MANGSSDNTSCTTGDPAGFGASSPKLPAPKETTGPASMPSRSGPHAEIDLSLFCSRVSLWEKPAPIVRPLLESAWAVVSCRVAHGRPPEFGLRAWYDQYLRLYRKYDPLRPITFDLFGTYVRRALERLRRYLDDAPHGPSETLLLLIERLPGRSARYRVLLREVATDASEPVTEDERVAEAGR